MAVASLGSVWELLLLAEVTHSGFQSHMHDNIQECTESKWDHLLLSGTVTLLKSLEHREVDRFSLWPANN